MKTYALYQDSFFKNKPALLPSKLWGVIVERSSPRSKDYMIALFKAQYPEGKLGALEDIKANDEIILLYPDSIGLGYGDIEKELLKSAKVSVINGRQRHFKLTPAVYRKLKWRRFLEITLLPEILLVFPLIFIAFFLGIKDKITGRT